MSFSTELEAHLTPYRDDYRSVVNGWLDDGGFGLGYPALLVETYHYAKHSADLMARAAAGLEPAYDLLRHYLVKHIGEETGHEQWLLDDLENLGVARHAVERSRPLPETIHLVGSQIYVIDYLHPAGLLGYVYVMESTPPSEASLQMIHERFGVPREAMTCLARHGEADIEHSRELREMLDCALVTREGREAARVSATLALSNANRLIERLRAGDFVDPNPRRILGTAHRETPRTIALRQTPMEAVG